MTRTPTVGSIVHVYGPNGEGPWAGLVATVNAEDFELGDVVFGIETSPPGVRGYTTIGCQFVKRSPTGEPTPGCWNWPPRNE